MAERGAHLTVTSQAKPSIFEVVAQDSLTAIIHPAFRKIADFLASCNPERYGWLVRWFDEVFLVFNTAVQYHYLKKYGSSFAENFYGLQRIALKGMSHSICLPSREEKLSLLCLTIFPYLHIKLQNLAVKLRLNEVDGTSNEFSSQTAKLLLKVHAVLHMTWEGAILAQYLSYISGNSESHSPLLRLAGVTLKYNTMEQEDVQWSNVWDQFLKGNFSLPELTTRMIGSVLTRSLEFGAFFLQFLQWWNAEKSSTSLTALPIPDPHKVVPKKDNMYRNICPICLKTRKIETVLPVSGYVFCYRCIVGHLKTNKYCPVTKYPAISEELIRIYSSES